MSSPTASARPQDEPLVLNVRGNARLSVPGPLAQTTRYVLLEQEDWFEEEIRFVRRWLRRGMRAIDVGAAFGVYTVAMAQAVGDDGRVWAFEPTPASAEFLARNIALNGLRNVELIRAAVSDRSGEVAFALYPSSEDNEIVPARSGAVSVPATTLDEAARDRGWTDIDFLKLDVEGHELEAIRGGEDFLRRATPLVMLEIKKRGQIDLGALAPLAALGYRFYRLLPGPQVLAPFDEADPVDPYQINLFACKADRQRRLAEAGRLVPEGAEAANPPQHAWDDFARSMPYAIELSAGWGAAPGFFSGFGDKAYWRGLAAFAASRSATRDAADRCALLDQALELVGEAVASGGSPARRLSYARLAWELGFWGPAADTLFGLLEETEASIAEPFLAPGSRYDLIPVDGRPRDWLRCAVTEQYEKLRAFSSLFLPHDDSPAVLASIRELPFRSPEMDRRCQLVRMRLGEQARPEPNPMLCRQSEENLNPAFWCSA